MFLNLHAPLPTNTTSLPAAKRSPPPNKIRNNTDLWHDAASSFGTAEDADLHAASSSSGPHVPCPPLLMADRNYAFVPVPEKVSGHAS